MSTGNGDAVRVTLRDFQERKERREKLVVVTAYDSLFGKLVDESGVDAVLVGDSVGNLLAGYDTTLPVTLDQMVYHARATRAGVKRALLIVDMPFLTYQVSPQRALLNCGRVMAEGGADAVKLEGASDSVLAAVRAVTGAGIPVMGHLGFTPQSVNTLGGTRVQARDDIGARKIVEDAKKLEAAGAFSIVLELVPAKVAANVTKAVRIPTIGIGAGAQCSGQVLVLHDLLGLNDGFNPKFLKRYASMAAEVRDAVSRFAEDVRDGNYPDDDHSF
ncbi:MAG: 3-methyl-2-oxobutanoate hydroxymethyltransferase [Gemmatimonadaceae bacterium]|nr:3-methyl-2-oxobutanoate hydroxymethyltransferase [Gemmatimonadaceae bacterium]